ncbi:MAG TPA: nucleoside hydrolase, partial [Acidimicrobiia bacterium]
PDDAVALLCAVAHPQIELVGVSTVGADAAWRADVACQLMPAGITVVAGAPAAVEAIPAAMPDAVLAIGPLTNLAALATIARLPSRLVVMGGALRPVRHRGAVRAVESNFAADPRAAAVVLAEPGVTLVPLDATVATRVDPPELEALISAAPALLPAVEAWLVAQDRASVPDDERAVHLHDPAALLVAAGEPVARLETRRLVVEGDGRLRQHPDGVDHQVVVSLDGRAVVARVLELLTDR